MGNQLIGNCREQAIAALESGTYVAFGAVYSRIPGTNSSFQNAD